ncbi:MAG: hypothetical protein U0166_00780 [Acidobacteriota bacterium]
MTVEELKGVCNAAFHLSDRAPQSAWQVLVAMDCRALALQVGTGAWTEIRGAVSGTIKNVLRAGLAEEVAAVMKAVRYGGVLRCGKELGDDALPEARWPGALPSSLSRNCTMGQTPFIR